MRLIDADEAFDYLLKCKEAREAMALKSGKMFDYGVTEGFRWSGIAIHAMPTVDAVQVVRCKDCKHWKDDIFQIGDNFVGICRRKAAIKSEFSCTADGFCSWAERKEE